MYITAKSKRKIIKFINYIYLITGLTFISFIDLFVFPDVSMVALYSVPLVFTGLYFPRPVAYATAIFAWLMGLLAEIKYVVPNELFFRYLAIAVLFILILWITIKLSKQRVNLKKNKEHQHDLILNIIQSLSSAVQAKDLYLKGHSRNVANVAKKIALNLNLPEQEVNNIYYAAVLHDIGKIGIPETILNKPDRLTETEYNYIKQHSTIGANIVKQVEDFKPFISYIECHHEHWDGSGYPHGYKGEEIPLGARIISLADAFDAMISERSYKKPYSIVEAIEEIRRGLGKQFDPQVGRAFLECGECLRAEGRKSSYLQFVKTLNYDNTKAVFD